MAVFDQPPVELGMVSRWPGFDDYQIEVVGARKAARPSVAGLLSAALPT